MKKFILGTRSLNELKGVHHDLAKVVRLAITITSQDFSVHDGVRTLAEQTVYFKTGVSKTMKSKHLPQDDGLGRAVDLVPWINGKWRWEWPAMYPIASAMRAAAENQGVTLRWGGTWSTLTGTTEDPEVLVRQYVELQRRKGQSAFIDGPHYELSE